jgi:hypothetical protein
VGGARAIGGGCGAGGAEEVRWCPGGTGGVGAPGDGLPGLPRTVKHKACKHCLAFLF